MKKSNKMTPVTVQILKALLFLGAGVILIVQPWLSGISWLGWVIVAITVMIALATVRRLIQASRMQKSEIASFASGDAVYEKGLKIADVLYDFSTFGAEMSGASLKEGKLWFSYSFYARRGGRAEEMVSIPVNADEEQKAWDVLAALNLPEVKWPAEEDGGSVPEQVEPLPDSDEKEL